MSKQIEILKPIPKGWTQLSDHCFIDENGDSRLRKKSTYKISTTKLSTKSLEEKIEYSNKNRKQSLNTRRKNPKKNYKMAKKWKKDNPKKYQKYMKDLNDSVAECKKLVLKFRRKKNSKQYIKINKRITDKRKKRGIFSGRCAEYKHNGCKNILGKCKCPCHKNT